MWVITVTISLLFLISCSLEKSYETHPNTLLAKSIINKRWQKNNLGVDHWYYRMTVVEAATNTQALSIAEGHAFHPELIKWEITKDMLIGWQAYAAVVNAEGELDPITQKNFKGPPVIAFAIKKHLNIDNTQCQHWHKCTHMDIDWAKNIVSHITRNDGDEGILSQKLASFASYDVGAHDTSDPLRRRISNNAIEFVVRHALSPSIAAIRKNKFGRSYADDTAAPMISVRHFFLKKKKSDFIPLFYPDKIDDIMVNDRFGFFRTNIDGRGVYDKNTGTLGGKSFMNANIFNIWQRHKTHSGNIIPMENRAVKPIVYYTNVLHPDELIKSSFKVAKKWNQAFKETILYAQAKKYNSIDEVPDVWLLKLNSCNVTNVDEWLSHKRSDLRSLINLDEIKTQLDSARNKTSHDFTKKYNQEIWAKKKLEQLCSLLEFHTQDDDDPFIYQRPGDLRFNLINLETGNNTTSWSGYGPMFSDPLTGETISATANINLKHIDLTAQKAAKEISLLNSKDAHLLAVYGNTESPHEDLSYEKEVANFFSLNKQDHEHKSALHDPISYIDDIAISSSLRWVDLSEHERFLKIRKTIYESVLLHELGHNLGLRHNMAATADPLNYHKDFWQLSKLPKNIEDALRVVTDQKIYQKLMRCLNKKALFDNMPKDPQGKRIITTQICLGQDNYMYSSIMDYHASSLSNTNKLGKYDKAAIKWAYAQLVEVFPTNKLAIDGSDDALINWLKLNSYKDIPNKLLKSSKAIDERQYIKFAWTDPYRLYSFPKNAVPYSYCDDPTGNSSPKCRAFDFGPDIKSSAKWLRKRYWQQFLSTHFAKNESWSGAHHKLNGITRDIDTLNRLTDIMRWYHKYLKVDKDFSGSLLERNFLQAMAIGLNLIAQIIALPEPGAHVTAPNWSIENTYSLPIGSNRLAPSKIAIPIGELSLCEFKSITSKQMNITYGINGFSFIEVPMGIGRPFYSNANSNYIFYSGSSLVKKYALFLLSAPMSNSHDYDALENQDLLSKTWYKTFPKAVARIYNSVITQDYQAIGFTVDQAGNIIANKVLDEKSLKLTKPSNKIVIKPAINQELSLFALNTAINFIPKTVDKEVDLTKAIRITCKGCSDNISIDNPPMGSLITYHHLYGQEYSAVDSGDESIGAHLIYKLKQQKERYLAIEQCLNNNKFEHPICKCIKTKNRNTFNEWQCLDEPELIDVDDDLCTIDELIDKKDQSLEQLNAMVGYVDHLRKLFSNSKL